MSENQFPYPMDLLCRDHPDFRCEQSGSIMDKFTLKGKKAFVTGAGGGIGFSTAKAFAELGADVCITDIPMKEDVLKAHCEYIEKTFGHKAIYTLCDVSDQQQVWDAVNFAADQLGTIDVCHSNAGIIQPMDNADVDVEEFRKIININLVGIMLTSRACANIMKRDGHGGSIINTASMSGHIVNRTANKCYGFGYSTTKAGVLHLTHAMALEYIKYGIRVNSVSPGVVLSGIHDPVPVNYLMTALEDIPAGHFGHLIDIAGAVAYLATDLAEFCVGTDLQVDGGQPLN